MKNNMVFSKKLKIALSYHRTIPLKGICPEELEGGSQKRICTSTFTVTLFHNGQKCESNPGV